ncbi:MAG: fumarylacetoacetate hydrolase family protein [Saprospiraceae bacterium]|nr:fumarylacetoacetate hydrolase family protein [Saprospiraceae bacterium]MBK7736292.1 fumarylacetoacetate hydrolase family protein [Saprospiraceae bacterium]MBK7912342.1 fumarylacetoacetate hydrolase family protein [Saprospiraceae bacterium]
MKIFCIGRNYSDHAKELNNPVPQDPVVFMKPVTALLQNNKAFYYPNFTKDLHHEIELVYKIGKKGRSIPEDRALNYLSEITVGIDFTARDLQQKCKEKGLPWEIAKAFDHSAVVGKWIPIQELDLDNLKFHLSKNEQTIQKGISNEMIFPIQKIISYLSQFFTLSLGDLIYSGTPSGVGPVQIGDQLKGFLNDVELFQTEIR